MTQERRTNVSRRGGEFWSAFEQRLATKPRLSEDADTLHDLLRTAYADATSRPESSATPEEYADVVYRLRFGLGPTVAVQTLEEVRQAHEVEALRLIAEGVDPRLLGLVV